MYCVYHMVNVCTLGRSRLRDHYNVSHDSFILVVEVMIHGCHLATYIEVETK